MVDSFHRITTATTVALDVLDGRCLAGAPLTISADAAASDMVNSECLYDVMQSVAAAGRLVDLQTDRTGIACF